MDAFEELRPLLDRLTPAECQAVFSYIRGKVRIHPIEAMFQASAEQILEAISRASDLTHRGIRGIIAEAAFANDVIPALKAWQSIPIEGDQPYDFLLEDAGGRVRVQVKMQRSKRGVPLRANQVETKRHWSQHHFVVETQRTRSGTTASGGATRPYAYGSFDILGVSLGPSTGTWAAFVYTIERWLIPSPDNAATINHFQPVSPGPTPRWTDRFEIAVQWLRSGAEGRVDH